MPIPLCIAVGLDLFQFGPGGRNIGLREARVVDKVQVDVFYAQLSPNHDLSTRTLIAKRRTYVVQTVLDGGFNIQTVQARVLCGDVDILPSQPTLTKGDSCLSFVPVCLRGIFEKHLFSQSPCMC